MVDYSLKIAKVLEGIAPVELAGTERELSLPMILIMQSSNASAVRFEGQDFLTESRYQVDCYAETPEKCVKMAEEVNARLQAEGWQRTSGQLVGRQRFLLNFKAIVDEKYNVYAKE